MLSGENIGSRFVVPTVAGCVDIVVHIATDRDGTRRVREVVGVPGRVEGDVVELEPIFVRQATQLVRADGYPPHAERFADAGYDLADLLGGHRGAPAGGGRALAGLEATG
jgi:pilus assembly protein CpaF